MKLSKDNKSSYRYCVGCKQGVEYCIFRHWTQRYRCPCGECLVKTMCDNRCDIRRREVDEMVTENEAKKVTSE